MMPSAALACSQIVAIVAIVGTNRGGPLLGLRDLKRLSSPPIRDLHPLIAAISSRKKGRCKCPNRAADVFYTWGRVEEEMTSAPH